MGCFEPVFVVCNEFGLVLIGLGWFGLVGAGLDWGWIEGKWYVLLKMQLVDTIASKRKMGFKRRPFSGHKMRTKSVKADYRPSYLLSYFRDRQVGAFLGPRLIA